MQETLRFAYARRAILPHLHFSLLLVLLFDGHLYIFQHSVAHVEFVEPKLFDTLWVAASNLPVVVIWAILKPFLAVRAFVNGRHAAFKRDHVIDADRTSA